MTFLDNPGEKVYAFDAFRIQMRAAFAVRNPRAFTLITGLTDGGFAHTITPKKKRAKPMFIDDVERFTEGDCHILARRIHRMTGWPIHCFYNPEADPDQMLDHVFNITPDGRAVDVEGVHTIRKFCKKYGFRRNQHREFPLRTVIAEWGWPDFGHYSYQRARIVADRLISEYEAGRL